MSHKHFILIPAVIFFTAALAQAGEPSRSPAVTGPAIIADGPFLTPNSLLKDQATQVLGSNSLTDQLTVRPEANPAVVRGAPRPKREPALAPTASTGGGATMDIR